MCDVNLPRSRDVKRAQWMRACGFLLRRGFRTEKADREPLHAKSRPHRLLDEAEVGGAVEGGSVRVLLSQVEPQPAAGAREGLARGPVELVGAVAEVLQYRRPGGVLLHRVRRLGQSAACDA